MSHRSTLATATYTYYTVTSLVDSIQNFVCYMMLSLPHRLWFSSMLITFLLFATGAESQVQDADSHTKFLFNEFNGTNLILVKDAYLPREPKVIKLTNNSHRMLGRALYSIPVRMKGGHNRSSSTNASLSFSTTFVFSIGPYRPSDTWGHGMAFLMTPHTSLMGAIEQQYLGLFNYSSNNQSYNHLFAVEFDTNQNDEFQDINDNHVGVDLNSLASIASEPAGYWIDDNHFQNLTLKGRQNIQAWIDYQHLRKQLDVTITLAGSPKPIRPLISVKNIDLSDILQDHMYVGFSAATGSYVEEHVILAWSFSTEGTAPALDLSRLPSFEYKKSGYWSVGFTSGVAVGCLLLAFAFALAVFYSVKAVKCRESIEEWELEYWPHRFSYREICIATKGFADEEVLGTGRFGKIYMGIIPSSGIEVAIKCIAKEVAEGMKEFVAEISSMGRLQHRNLLQLRGWCRNKKQLFIVYDYMANGSLDKMIFGHPKTALRWSQRYVILKGVAAGLLYLHEEWEKRVVHRDIKSSNVLLDSDLNPRLGDFGLARLYDHSQNPQTTRVMGTLGYIAPEVVHTGKASPNSDVFSFGVLMLEVASGRRPVDRSRNAEEVVLVDWTWDLYLNDKLLCAADPKLGGEYAVEEMERVLQLGLCCSYPEPEARLNIRHVLKVLEGEAPLPLLPLPSFNSRIVRNISRRRSYCHVSDLMSSGSSNSKGRDDAFSTTSANEERQLSM